MVNRLPCKGYRKYRRGRTILGAIIDRKVYIQRPDLSVSQNYKELLTEMESLAKSATDESAARLRKALVVVSSASTSFPAPPVLTRPLPYRLCEAVCAYKLIDVLYDLQEQESPSMDNPLYPKLRIKEYLPNEVKYSSVHLTTHSGLTPEIRIGLYTIGFYNCAPRRQPLIPCRCMVIHQCPGPAQRFQRPIPTGRCHSVFSADSWY